MIDIPREIRLRFDACLTKEPIPEQFYHFYRRWLRFYFDFCSKYRENWGVSLVFLVFCQIVATPDLFIVNFVEAI